MRLMMMGTGPFGAPIFESLLEAGLPVLSLVTRPARQSPGRHKPPPSPLRAIADRSGIPILEPDDINSPAAHQQLESLAADLFVVCDYGQILSRGTLALATRGGVNLHGSLLPRYRGAAPVNWAIYHGEKVTGVTVIHMSPQLDAGPILATRSTPIGPEETTPELEVRLARLGIAPVHEALEQLAAWDGRSPLGQPQDPSLASRAPRLKKEDGLVDWRRTAEQIFNQVRAFKPWPGTFTYWLRAGSEPLRLILDQVSATAASGGAPGTVVRGDRDQLWIAAGEGAVVCQRVQPAGKRIMQIDEFLRGHPVGPGEQFGQVAFGD